VVFSLYLHLISPSKLLAGDAAQPGVKQAISRPLSAELRDVAAGSSCA
jgi:hypothetical protein